MMQASIHGRLGKDAQAIATRTGNPMAAASVAVDVSTKDREATVWVRVTAFGKLAELLQRHTKGDTIAAAGKLELSKWTAEDGTERESWNLTADSLVSARTVRPGGGKRQQQEPQHYRPSGPDWQAPRGFDDTIPPF